MVTEEKLIEEGKTYDRLGEQQHMLGDFKSTISNYQKAIDCFNKAKSNKKSKYLAITKRKLGDYYRDNNDAGKSLVILNESLKNALKSEENEIIGATFLSLGNYYFFSKRNYNQSLDYFNKAEEEFNKVSDNKGLGIISYSKGYIEEELKNNYDFKYVKSCYGKAFNLLKNESPYLLSTLYIQVGNLCSKHGMYEATFKNFFEAIKINNQYEYDLSKVIIGFSKACLLFGEYQRALDYLSNAIGKVDKRSANYAACEILLKFLYEKTNNDVKQRIKTDFKKYNFDWL